MEFKMLIIERVDNIAVLKINRPDAMNSLNNELLNELNCALEQIDSDEQIRVLIITGEGRAFVAGADIEQMSTMNVQQGKEFGVQGSAVFRKLENISKPVIAAINGFALGGGCELALACDIRIASNKAKIGQPEVGLGITPGFSGTQRLPRLVGEGKAKELIYTAKAITAEEALAIGLVNMVVEPQELLNAAMQMAKTIAKNAPIALKLSKEAINRGMQTDIDSSIAIENNLFALCFGTQDQKEGMKAFFEKRPPEWKNQ
ncbi:MAG: short-chain-enoyl-CoA hydratase [Bacteroidales bacterium]|nr:short-chain-enoyl-CoA hydratase [Bacteroidales bacterium]